MEKILYPLWRNKAPSVPLKNDYGKFSIGHIFPSARQALSFAISSVGLRRPHLIAIPEWSSHCVISSVGEIATPISIREVINYDIPVDGILLYEQWGWPFSPSIQSTLEEKFKNCKIILDRVDSADINNKNRMILYPEFDQIDLISFSKILGLIGGGLVKLNGVLLNFSSDLEDKEILNNMTNIPTETPKLINIYKNNIKFLHPELMKWLKENDILKALENEGKIRHENLSKIINSDLSFDWPEWMMRAFKDGACPGIVPLLKRQNIDILLKTQKYLLNSYGIETVVYHFNWSGNPLRLKYEKVLAFPIHGLLTKNLPNIIENLEKKRE